MSSLSQIVVLALLGNAGPAVLTPFSTHQRGGPPPGAWQPWLFDGKQPTRYLLVKDADSAGTVVLAAQSHASASALCHPVSVDPAELPILTWRWKVRHPVPGANLATRHGDDSPARVLLAFADEGSGFWQRLRRQFGAALTDGPVPTTALTYVWGSPSEEGKLVANAHMDAAMMIVLHSGRRAGAWIREQRDVYRDYLEAFGRPPPRIVGVAVMSDTDNTGTSAEAWFGDIAFSGRTRHQ